MLKSFPKILIIVFLSTFIVQLFCLVLLLTLPQASQAAEIKFTPQVGIPGADSKFKEGSTYPFTDASTKPIAEYIQTIYKYAIGIVGILAAVVLMVGGVLWIVAGGNATQVGEAKAWITAALTGLVLALCSYLILNTVNPALVNLKTTNITGVSQMPTATTTAATPCCAWEEAPLASLVCVGCNGPVYVYCDHTDPTMTLSKCKNKPASTYRVSYEDNGECKEYSLIGTSATFLRKNCQPKANNSLQ